MDGRNPVVGDGEGLGAGTQSGREEGGEGMDEDGWLHDQRPPSVPLTLGRSLPC